MLLPSLSLEAASLIYDPAGGQLTGFKRVTVHSPDNPDGYAGKKKSFRTMKALLAACSM